MVFIRCAAWVLAGLGAPASSIERNSNVPLLGQASVEWKEVSEKIVCHGLGLLLCQLGVQCAAHHFNPSRCCVEAPSVPCCQFPSRS